MVQHYLKQYLKTSWLYFSTKSDLLVLRLIDVDGVKGAKDLSDDVVPGVAVEAEDDEVQSDAGQLIEINAVKGEVLVVNGIPGFAQHPSFDFVLLVGEQLQLDVGVARAQVGIFRWKVSAPHHRDY